MGQKWSLTSVVFGGCCASEGGCCLGRKTTFRLESLTCLPLPFDQHTRQLTRGHGSACLNHERLLCLLYCNSGWLGSKGPVMTVPCKDEAYRFQMWEP